MKNLKIIYDKILSKKSLWYYYDKPLKGFGKNPLHINNVLSKSKKFISEYLHRGGKLVYNSLVQEPIEEYRYRHTISLFFLGLHLYLNCKIINENINKLIEKIKISLKNEQMLDIDFPYLWFITCFFHDFGYSHENNFSVFLRHCNKIENYPKKLLGVPKEIKKLWQKYFIYRIVRFNKIDHGITAGLLLYNYLHKRYNELRSENDKYKNTECFIEDETGLYWSKRLLETIHLRAISAIIAHNIWIVNESDPKKINDINYYKIFGLEELVIPENQNLIDVHSHPLLFLLCLVDTIEPLKLDMKKNNGSIPKPCINNFFQFFQNFEKSMTNPSLSNINHGLSSKTNVKAEILVLNNFKMSIEENTIKFNILDNELFDKFKEALKETTGWLNIERPNDETIIIV